MCSREVQVLTSVKDASAYEEGLFVSARLQDDLHCIESTEK